MKHLKYIKEYFDSEEIKNDFFISGKEIKTLVSDDSILKSNDMSTLINTIKLRIPYFKNYNYGTFDDGVFLNEAFDYYLDLGESVLATSNIDININDDDNVYDILFEGFVYRINDDKKTILHMDKYESEKLNDLESLIRELKIVVSKADNIRKEYLRITRDDSDRSNQINIEYN